MRMPRPIALEDLMPRFYFDLTSKDEHITDDGGRELDTLKTYFELNVEGQANLNGTE